MKFIIKFSCYLPFAEKERQFSLEGGYGEIGCGGGGGIVKAEDRYVPLQRSSPLKTKRKVGERSAALL